MIERRLTKENVKDIYGQMNKMKMFYLSVLQGTFKIKICYKNLRQYYSLTGRVALAKRKVVKKTCSLQGNGEFFLGGQYYMVRHTK